MQVRKKTRKRKENETRYERNARLVRHRIYIAQENNENSSDNLNLPTSSLLNSSEEFNMNQRMLRRQKTTERNIQGQRIIIQRASNTNISDTISQSTRNNISPRELDDRNFYQTINEPLTCICGSCGELANACNVKILEYDESNHFFFTLSMPNDNGLIEEAIVTNEVGAKTIPFCTRCYISLKAKRIPKFCKRSGINLGFVPEELAKLNDMEARMIGLGVCFTTCYRLKGGGQDATRGNCISYWNQLCATVSKLPRPVSKCGVVYLRTNSQHGCVYQIRPNYIRAALYWLIRFNPLYATIQIDEQLLQQLQESYNLPELLIDEADVEKDTIMTVGEESGNTNTTHYMQETDEELCLNTLEGNCVETFELPRDDLDCQTESERVLDILLRESSLPNFSTPDLTIPMNEYTDSLLMQQCFPTLFPFGVGGYNPIDNEYRKYSYHLAEYCAHLMMWRRRFVIHPSFKFFCLNIIHRRQVDGLTKRAYRPRRDNSTATSNDRDEEIKQILKQLKPYFRSIRGSGLYWANVRSELMAMLGSEALSERWPTFFFKFSAADTIWPDFFVACNPMLSREQASAVPSDERNRYLNQYPDIAVRHFYRRFQAFMTHIILGKSRPIGHVVDYFWRVEFQKRGSPHIHGLLWIEDAPNVKELSKTEVGRLQLAHFVDQYIHAQTLSIEDLQDCHCEFCLNDRNNIPNLDILTRQAPENVDYDECDLRRVVNRVQQHICFPNSICHQKNGRCRFSYPKELRECTEIEIEQVSGGVQRLQVHLKRNNPYINYFNPTFIVRWRANMDMKLIGNAFGAAEYTASYISKSEPDTSRFRTALRKALDRTRECNTPYTTLRQVANATISVREISAQETMWILLPGLMMTDKTCSVLKIKTLRHEKRSHWVSPDDCLHMAEEDTNHDNINDEPRIDFRERLYMARPYEEPFISMTYQYFCEHYEQSNEPPKKGQLLQRFQCLHNMGYIKTRKKSHVILKTPTIKPNVEDPDYCFQELLLRKSWRHIEELPTRDEDCILQFESFRTNDHNILEIIERANAMEILASQETPFEARLPGNEWGLQDVLNDLTDNNESRTFNNPSLSLTRCTVEEYNRAEKFVATQVSNYVTNKNTEQEHSRGIRQYLYPIGLDQYNMNYDQWIAFAICMKQSRLRYRSPNNVCTPISMILNGEGGSGKSWLIQHIVKDVYEVFDKNQRQTQLRVLLLAHQGTAAFNIGGSTICSGLSIPRNYSNNYISLSERQKTLSTLKRLQDKYENVHLVIIDEFSVISCRLLYWIDRRLREIFPRHNYLPFGGRDIIFAGDMGQLAPVNAKSLSTPEGSLEQTIDNTGRKLWTNIKTVCNLRSQNRGINDQEWYDALRRLRTMDETINDLHLFNTRVQSSSLHPNWVYNATHIAYTNEEVNRTNEQCIMFQSNQVFEFPSYYNYSEKGSVATGTITEEMIQHISSDLNKSNQTRDSVVPRTLRLAVGASVALTYNVCQGAGLCNGTKGIVHDILTCSEKKNPIVLVRITDRYSGPSFLDIPNVIPITSKAISCPVKNENIRVSRIGIPLRLAYGMTIHKVQGLTCAKVVFNPTGIPSSSFAYVALSRVRNREDIILTHPLQKNETTYQIKQKQILHNECTRLENLATVTSTQNQALIRHMQYIATIHNQHI